jgi:hypothetical protein
MDKNESERKLCLKRQTELHEKLTKLEQPEEAIHLFLQQHASLHSARMAGTANWSFEDWLLDDLDADQMRMIPSRAEHSIAWLVWHVTRCEDITMNLLIAGSAQVLFQENWLDGMQVSASDTGNAMNPDEISAFSLAVNIEALRAYRIAVGRCTRDIASHLELKDLKRKVDPQRVQLVREQKAVMPGANGIIEYWSKRTWGGLLLMPASRHIVTHWNEVSKIKPYVV